MDQQVQNISEETLTPLVMQIVGDSSAEISHFQTNPVLGGMGSAVGGTAIYRITGQTTQANAWSLILKILYPRPHETEDSPYYWKREYEIYRSGLLNQLPDVGLTTPTIYQLEEVGDACWIWMADIAAAVSIWTLADYQLVARRLGRFNGVYVSGAMPIPQQRWLTTSWHCTIIPGLADTFANLDLLLQHPLAQRTLPLSEKATIQTIWQQTDRYCTLLTNLPQTFCHYDAFRGNIFHQASHSILIDWALAGQAAIGEELVSLVSLSLYFPDQLTVDADVLDAAIFSSYVAGLRDVGWQGDSRLARLGYTCAMTLRGLAGVKQDITLLCDPQKFAQLGWPDDRKAKESKADLFAQVRRFRLLKMSAEADRLLIEYNASWHTNN